MIALAVALTVSTASLRAVYPPAKTYEVSVPREWKERYNWKALEPGFEVVSPDGNSSVGVYFFPSDKSEFRTPEEYLKRQGVPTDPAVVAGRMASRLSRVAHIPSGPEKKAPDLVLRQTRVVLPVERGFYLFLLDQPMEGDENAMEAFRILLNTFKLKNPPRKPIRPL